MHLEWQQAWSDIVETTNKLLPLCEDRLNVLQQHHREKSGEVLARVRQQLETDTDSIRRQPHLWGTQLAQVAVRVAKQLPPTDANCPTIAELANYCALVFDYRRKSDRHVNYEGLFRDSVQLFLGARLPNLVEHVIAPDLLDETRDWLRRFYDKVPKDFWFVVNDMILTAYETRRRKLDIPDTHGLMVRFVEDNKDLISLPVSEAREAMRTRWEDIYRNQIGEPPPSPGDRVINAALKGRLKKSVQTNDAMAIRDIIAPIEPTLVKAVKDTLDVSFEFREPRRTVQNYARESTAEFERARRQIRNTNQQAVTSFYEVWRGQPQNTVAKQWYAYSKAKLDGGWREAKDLFEEVRDADRGDQLTDWNLACCEVKLGNRQAAFTSLSQRVDSGSYIDEVLEPAIALALELGEKAFLGKHLRWVPLEEAVLLGYLYAADTKATQGDLEDWLSAIEVISLSDNLFQPPHPAEYHQPFLTTFALRLFVAGWCVVA